MTDPFDVLHEPVVPVDPDPRFAARLRALLERALIDPGGATMSTTTFQGDVAYASVWTPDVDRAEAFYSAVLGWRMVPGHHYVQGLGQHLGLAGGQERRSTFLSHAVDDIADAVRRIRQAGGTAGEPTQESYGLSAMCADDQGLPFAVHQEPHPVERPATGTGVGEIAYLTFHFPDSTKALAFYGAVFGWQFTARGNDSWGIDEVRPMSGLRGGQPVPRVLPMYTVADIADAVVRVREAGGTATEVAQRPYGLESECTDDQGTPFYLGQF